jgi:uncharacterized membrane protein YhfC
MNLGQVFIQSSAFYLPLGLFLYVIFYHPQERLALSLGILSFSVSQLLMRIPLLNLLSTQAFFIVFSMKYVYGFIAFLSITAALFEETARYFFMRRGLKSLRLQSILSFGLGHGGIEAIVLVGISTLFTSASLVDSTSLFYGGFERLSAMLLHMSLSVMVALSIQNHSKTYLFMAYGLHTVVNFALISLLQLGINVFILELSFFVFSVLLFFYLIKRTQK